MSLDSPEQSPRGSAVEVEEAPECRKKAIEAAINSSADDQEFRQKILEEDGWGDLAGISINGSRIGMFTLCLVEGCGAGCFGAVHTGSTVFEGMSTIDHIQEFLEHYFEEKCIAE